jgi:cell division transport system ATP-binding protein
MITFFHVTKVFPGGQPALSDVCLNIERGEFVVLMGQSGSGKSTLLKSIYMELLPDSGEVVVEKFRSSGITRHEIALLRRQLGVVFQDFKLLGDRSIVDNVAFALQITGVNDPRTIQALSQRALHRVGLHHRRFARPTEMSGGEQQRVAIARAIVNDPVFLLADEPTGNLDAESGQQVFDLLRGISLGGTGVLVATHDLSRIDRERDRVVEVDGGRVREAPRLYERRRATPATGGMMGGLP